MITKRSREGELLIDHRFSPGLPANFFRQIGLQGDACPEGTKLEMATLTCAHCNAVVVLEPRRTRPRGHCFKCNAYICDNPACHAACTPFSKVLDDLESQAYRAGQNHLILKGF